MNFDIVGLSHLFQTKLMSRIRDLLMIYKYVHTQHTLSNSTWTRTNFWHWCWCWTRTECYTIFWRCWDRWNILYIIIKNRCIQTLSLLCMNRVCPPPSSVYSFVLCFFRDVIINQFSCNYGQCKGYVDFRGHHQDPLFYLGKISTTKGL